MIEVAYDMMPLVEAEHRIVARVKAEKEHAARPKGMLERDIESRSRKRAEAAGKRLMKFTSPGHAFVPDDILLAPIPEWLRPVVAKYFRFVEFKRTGAKPTAAQLREHERLRSFGFVVEVVDSVEAADRVFAEMGD